MKGYRAHLERMMSGFLLHYRVRRFDEIIPVAHGLDQQKNPVEQQRRHDKKDCLFGGERWLFGGKSEDGQHQTEHGQGHDHIEVRINSLEIVILLTMTHSAQ